MGIKLEFKNEDIDNIEDHIRLKEHDYEKFIPILERIKAEEAIIDEEEQAYERE